MTDDPFGVDAGERLKELLGVRKMGQRERLAAAASLGGRQLEWLRPAVMMMGPKGFTGALAASVERGTILIVLADAKRVATIHLRVGMLPAEVSLTEFLDGLVKDTEKLMPRDWTAGDTLQVMRLVVQQHGGRPGKISPAIDPVVLMQIVGGLFAGLPRGGRHRLVAGLEETARHDVCPAMIGLIGKNSSGKAGTYSGAWPLVMPLAPYITAIEERGVPADG